MGLLVALVVGGLGSRLAMRVIAATSDPRLHGTLTSDNEPIGEISLAGTVSLVGFVGLAGGLVLGLGYLGVRRALPADVRVRAAVAAVLVWCLGASTMFHADDFDFRMLEPRWLSVAMFSAIFLAAGALTAVLVERAIDRWPAPTLRTGWRYLPLLVLAVVPPIVAVLAGLVALSAWQPARRAWSSPVVALVGRAALVAIAAVLGLPAVGQVLEIV